jgi:hypothetical protein
VAGRWFSWGTPVSSNNETYHHDRAELLLKVAKDIINHKPVIGNYYTFCWLVGLMVFNITSNNISVISWWSVLLMEETGGS